MRFFVPRELKPNLKPIRICPLDEQRFAIIRFRLDLGDAHKLFVVVHVSTISGFIMTRKPGGLPETLLNTRHSRDTETRTRGRENAYIIGGRHFARSDS